MSVISAIGGFISANAPTILKVVGATTSVAAVAVAAYEGYGLVNELVQENVDWTNAEAIYEEEGAVGVTMSDGEVVPETNIKKLRVAHYARYGILVAKRMFIPALLVGGSIASWCGAISIITARMGAALETATVVAATIAAEYADYRANVVAISGEDKDFEYLHGYKKTDKVDIVAAKNVNDETDEAAVAVEHIKKTGEYSQYARIFDEYNPRWSPCNSHNAFFLKTQQAYANTLLHLRGTLFLNDVYEILGFEKTKVGQVVGWTDKDGAGFVDFGIYAEGNKRFLEENEDSVILDFNVDGIVIDNLW